MSEGWVSMVAGPPGLQLISGSPSADSILRLTLANPAHLLGNTAGVCSPCNDGTGHSIECCGQPECCLNLVSKSRDCSADRRNVMV